MTTAEKLYTVEEFLALPDDPSGGKMELVAGRVCLMSPVGETHGSEQAELSAALLPFARAHRLGIVGVETGFRIAAATVLAPDVAFVSNDRLDPNRDRTRFIEGAPTLAVEVASPSDAPGELVTKAGDYLQAGTERVWVVQPEAATVTVFTAAGEARTFHRGEALTSAEAGFVVEGFELKLDDLFA